MAYETRVTGMMVLPVGKRIFHEAVSQVYIEDDTAGEYVVVRQEEGKIGIYPAEWAILRDVIDRMVKECRPDDSEDGK